MSTKLELIKSAYRTYHKKLKALSIFEGDLKSEIQLYKDELNRQLEYIDKQFGGEKTWVN